MSHNKLPVIWSGPNGAVIPSDVHEPQQIVSYATSLTPKQKDQIAKAFSNSAYDMGAEYVWRKAISKLRTTLQSLGMRFIGEMLGRDDVDDSDSVDSILTEYNTILLAEQLGAINSTGALKLRQSLEIIQHFFSEQAEREKEELGAIEAATVVSACVKYVLSEERISVAIEFTQFRDRLLKEDITASDNQIEQLINSPAFFLRTTIAVLLNAIRNTEGAQLEHSLTNLNILLPLIWAKLGEKEKWNIGSAYRDVSASGTATAVKGLKRALLKVSGFDYVPENLRSQTYKKYARALIDAHFAINNFYNEGPIARKFAALGTSIPEPALLDCLQAFLCVYLGNTYGSSFTAAPIAESQLKSISLDRWEYYFARAIHSDEMILSKIQNQKPFSKFNQLAKDINFSTLTQPTGINKKLLDCIVTNKREKACEIAKALVLGLTKR